MIVNVSGIVQVDSVNVSAQVGTKSVNTSATIQQHNTDVSASVEHKTTNVSATAQTKSTNVGADVNPHVVQQNDHSRLLNLDYDNAGHTGFQKQLNSDNAGTGIEITVDPDTNEVTISNTQTSAEWGNITGDIDDQTDLTNALNSKQDALTAGTGITINENNVISNDVSPLVPAQATVDNQLADKDFVNSSIATSTATFRDTYNVVTDLHLSTSATHQQVATALGNTISVADNNDYCFVEIPTDDLTPTETLQVDRYKYNGTSWSFEYTLNNSGYTSAQWKAINSGITSGKVTQYDDYATNKQDKLIAGNNITIDVDGKTISSDIPQATSSVYGKVLLGAAGGAATFESVGDGKPICYPTTASEAGATSMNLKSSVSDNGLKLTEVGFVYNTSGNPTVSDTKVICDLGVGRIEKSLSGLTKNTTYYIKSYGINNGGTSYGDLLTKKTIFEAVNDIPEMLRLTPLPSDYTKLEFANSNNRYVNLDLGRIFNNGFEFYGDISINSNKNYNNFIGSFANNNANFFRFKNLVFGFGIGSASSSSFNYGEFGLNTFYTIKASNINRILKLKVDNIVYEYGLDVVYTTTSNITLSLFNSNGLTQSNNQYFNGKIKCVRISDETQIWFDLIPCFKNSTNQVGFYDIISNTFFGDNNLIGDVLNIDNVNINDVVYVAHDDEYYKWTGTQWQLLNIE